MIKKSRFTGRALEKLDPEEIFDLRCMGTIGRKRLIRAIDCIKRIII